MSISFSFFLFAYYTITLHKYSFVVFYTKMYYELSLMHFHEFSFIGKYYFFSFKELLFSDVMIFANIPPTQRNM